MTGRRYAGFWRRLVAYAVDKLILYAISVFLLLVAIAAVALGGFSAHRIVAGGNPLKAIGPFFLLYLGALFVTDMLYFTWFHGTVGQTPGKMLLKLRVIRASGEEMTFGAAFLRWAGTYVSGLFLSLGYLWIAVDARKQGWHDKIAATLVVREAEEPHPGTGPAAASPASGGPCPPAVGPPIPPAADAPPAAVSAPDSDPAAPRPQPAPPADAGPAAPRNIP